MTYKIEVRKEDIDAGLAGSCFSCPVALAMGAKEGVNCPQAGNDQLQWWDRKGHECWMKTPEHVSAFMEAFDDWRKTFPFTFELTDEREGA